MYYRGAAAAIVVYDISSTDSYVRAKNCVDELQRQGNPHLVMVLVGNKADLEEKRQVATQVYTFVDVSAILRAGSDGIRRTKRPLLRRDVGQDGAERQRAVLRTS